MTRATVSDASLAGKPIDLTNCDREPIHIPGSIQPHGCLLACDNAARTVQRYSQNAADMLGLDGDPVGKRLSEVIGQQNAHDLANALAVSGSRPRPALLFGIEVNGRLCDVTAHRYDGHTIIEFEPASEKAGTVISLARTVIERLRAAPRAETLIETAAALIQAQLGYDRVMVYELGSDGAGKVVSEAKLDSFESFRGQYFPASDIPQQARALYVRNPIRLIGDASFRPVPILPALSKGEGPLDLSYSHLRSVSPIHCEYLRNMGVSASMSVSIIIDGALWGLIACHHYSPKILNMADRAAAEMVGEFFSLHLDALRRAESRRAEQAARMALDDLMVDASRHDDIGAALHARLPQLADLIDSEGIGLLFDGKWTVLGRGPDAAQALPLHAFAEASSSGEVFSTDCLSELMPDAPALTDMVAGVLMIPLSRRPRNFLFYFRREAVQTLDWAGDPNKTYESGPFGDRLTPRKSFAIWKETVRGRSHPWSESDLGFAEAVRSSVVEVLLFNSELLSDERTRAAVRQRVLNQELNHRVKNILAVIQSLVSQKPPQNETVDGYIEALRGRIRALSFAHDQVVRDESGGQLHHLLRAELGPYADEGERIEMTGPAVRLDGRAYSVMALILHEMATNAAKYGALSKADGHLSIHWDLDMAGDCRIAWIESGLTGVTPPSRSGFGSALIERSLSFDLGGDSEVRFGETGLEAEFAIPACFVDLIEGGDAAKMTVEVETDADERADLQGARILLVEDQMLIAMALEADLRDEGFTVTGIAPNIETAIEMIRRDPPDLAVLDLNLNRETSIPVAESLFERGIPFVFATGYGRDLDLPQMLDHVPVVSKPYLATEIIEKLRKAAAAS